MDRKYFDMNDLDSAVAFAGRHPCKPIWSEDMARRFLGELTSGPDMIFDLYAIDQRAGLAVLLDKVTNKKNIAPLEFLGVCANYKIEIFETIIRLAQQSMPPHRSGIDVTFHESFPDLHDFAARLNLVYHYDVFEMSCALNGQWPVQRTIQPVTPADYIELYAVVAESVQDNPEISLSPFSDWVERGPKTDYFRLIRDNEKIIGFIHCPVTDGIAEIRLVGVLPQWRGQGIGRDLISHALINLKQQGVKTCELSVALQNPQAVALYNSLGFQETDRYTVMLWQP